MCEHVLCLLVGCVGGCGLELLLPFTSPLKKLGQSFLWRIQQRCFWQCGDVGGREGAVASRNVVRRAEEGLVGQLLYTVQPIQASGFHHCDAIPSMHNCQPQSFPLSLALEEGKKNMGSRSPRVWDQGLFSSWGSFSWVKMKGCSPFHSSLPLFFSPFFLCLCSIPSAFCFRRISKMNSGMEHIQFAARFLSLFSCCMVHLYALIRHCNRIASGTSCVLCLTGAYLCS